MAKELPYLKFEPSEWLEGNIQICSETAQLCFVNLMSGYWSKLGKMNYAFALHKYCKRDTKIIEELINNEIISVKDDFIAIDFLDKQLKELNKISKKRSESANKRWSNANALQMQSKGNAIRKEKNRRDKKEIQYSRHVSDLFKTAFNHYVEMRRLIKSKMTPKVIELAIKELDKHTEEVAIAMIEQSILNSWKGLYPIKDKKDDSRPIQRDSKPTPEWMRKMVEDIDKGKND